jgi:integration host factor subunit beta
MTRSDLVARLAAQYPELAKREVERAVSVILEEMIAALQHGGRVELRGFGAFTVRIREARAARNPMTGETVQVEPKTLPFFASGKALRQRLNNV